MRWVENSRLAGPGSDLDIMVVKPHGPNHYEEMIRLRKAVGSIGTGIDLLVYSEAEYERRSQVPGTLLYWARKERRPLYAATWVTDVRRRAEE